MVEKPKLIEGETGEYRDGLPLFIGVDESKDKDLSVVATRQGDKMVNRKVVVEWHRPPESAGRIVSLIPYRDYMVMATEYAVYKVVPQDDGDLVVTPVELEQSED